jgi:hypothetical protein
MAFTACDSIAAMPSPNIEQRTRIEVKWYTTRHLGYRETRPAYMTR